jgi:DNA-binding XRE family transcriptional regulator
MKSIPELSRADFARTLRRSQRQRIMRGELQPGDVAALRRLIGLTQDQFAKALGISMHTLRNWEQDRRKPVGLLSRAVLYRPSPGLRRFG